MINLSGTFDLDLCKSWNVKLSAECLTIQLSLFDLVVVEALTRSLLATLLSNFCQTRVVNPAKTTTIHQTLQLHHQLPTQNFN